MGEWIFRGLLTVFVTVGGFLINREINTLDRLESEVSVVQKSNVKTANSIELIKQEMTLRRQLQESHDDEFKMLLTDHEARLRTVERKTASSP